MKIAVTGANGRLGRDLVENWNCIPMNCDIRNVNKLEEELNYIKPDVIIHCAAVTNVDKCERELFHKALEVNWLGTRNIRKVFMGRILYVSTDYVFDGINGPYNEKQVPSPINHYGFTKYSGERVILQSKKKGMVIRTTRLFGGSKKDFVVYYINKLEKNKRVYVSKELQGNPTFVPHLSEALIDVTKRENPPNILNISGTQVLSRYGFARLVAEYVGHKEDLIIPINHARIGIAQRPIKAGLQTNLAEKMGVPVYSPEEGLERFFDT